MGAIAKSVGEVCIVAIASDVTIGTTELGIGNLDHVVDAELLQWRSVSPIDGCLQGRGGIVYLAVSEVLSSNGCGQNSENEGLHGSGMGGGLIDRWRIAEDAFVEEMATRRKRICRVAGMVAVVWL